MRKDQPDRNGLLIAIEGGDASGKATQTRFLMEELERVSGYEVTTFSFPRYEESMAARLSREITHGHYGDPLLLHPKIASLSFIMDRMGALDDLKEALSVGHVICDRYTPSNLVYQAAKLLPDIRAQDDFIYWLEKFEYQECGLPDPDLVLFLDVNPRVSRRLLAEHGRQLDKHEASVDYQHKVHETYSRLAHGRESWRVIHCLDDRNQLRLPEDIRRDITEMVLDYYQLLVGDEEGTA